MLAGAGTLTIVYSYVKEAPEFQPWLLQPPLASHLYERTGKEITTLYGEQNRVQISLEEIPIHVQNAFIAIEDERFYKHHGVDIFAIARAFFSNLLDRNLKEQGGSTITQQLVKNAMLTREKTLSRKIQEAWLAFIVERYYSKSEILEMYLNQIYFAHGAYGIESAANMYFGKKASELTIAEGALLAGIPRSPNFYSPYRNYESALQRQGLVLKKMYELKFINAEEYEETKEQPITLAEKTSREYPFPYFLDYVLHHELIDILTGLPEYESRMEAYEAIYNEGFKIYTTLDTNYQALGEAILNDESIYQQNARVDLAKMRKLLEKGEYSSYPEEVLTAEGIPQPQAALVAADPHTGEVLALIGGREYNRDNKELRYLSPRQPGSAIKPLVSYAPALEKKIITPGTIIDDAPFIRGDWAPENFDCRFHGLVTVREALIRSLNVPAVKVFEMLTPRAGLDFAEKMGISTFDPDDTHLAAALGGLNHGVTAFDMAQAYAVLANGGIKVDLHTVNKIEDRNGKIIYEYQRRPRALLSPQTAYLITDILQDVARFGTAANLQITKPIAAKTGTSSENRDAYLVTYTPDLVVSLWMGHDLKTLGKIGGGSQQTIPILNTFLKGALKDTPPTNFTRPSGISEPISICTKSGLRAGSFCPSENIREEIFPAGEEPQETCNLHFTMPICTRSGLLPGNNCPAAEIETRIFLQRPPYELTDERWKEGPGRSPEDAGLQPPTEYCQEHNWWNRWWW